MDQKSKAQAVDEAQLMAMFGETPESADKITKEENDKKKDKNKKPPQD